MATKIETAQKVKIHPLLDSRDRILILEKIKGIWKKKKPDPIRELKKMRKEWS